MTEKSTVNPTAQTPPLREEEARVIAAKEEKRKAQEEGVVRDW